MKRDWYTLLAPDGISNAGTSVLWSEYGFYQWINQDGLDGIIIEFFPRPGKPRVLERIGMFIGPDNIAHAEDAVERDILTRSGHWLATRDECDDLIAEAHEAFLAKADPKESHEFVSRLRSEFCDVCGRSCIGHE